MNVRKNVSELTDEELYSQYGRVMLDYQIMIEQKQIIEQEIAKRRKTPMPEKVD